MNIETEEKINSFFKYLGINCESLNSNDKLKILIDRRHELMLDYTLYDIFASNADNVNDIEKYHKRMEADKLVISEINMCISYLKTSIKKLNREELKDLFGKSK